MQKINFQNLPNTSTPLNATNLNQLQTNIENAINLASDYSTSETIIGKWIDARPIYRKVINFGELPNATTKSVTTGLLTTNVNIINYYGIANGVADNNKYVLTLPDINPNGASQATRLTINTENNYYMINILAGIDRSNYNAYIIVEYIKTTDPVG